MLRPPFLLRLDGLGLDAWQMHEKALRPIAAFAIDAAPDFAAWLRRQRPSGRYRLVLDVGDEAFEAEDLPRVRGADRRALLARRLAAYFPDPALAGAETLGAGPAAGLERVLFSGLTRPALLAPWMAALHAAGARLELLVPASRLLGHFAPRATRLEADTLLAGFTRAGMRLCHFAHGRRLFSRLVAGCTAEAAATDRQWLDELERTRRYVAGQHASAALPEVVVLTGAMPPLSHPDDGTPATPTAGLRFVAPDSLGLPPATPDLDALLLHWLAQAPRRLGWTIAPPRPATPHGRTAAALLGGGALVFAACATAAGLRWNELSALEHERDRLLQRQLAARRALAETEAARPALPLAPRALVDTITAVERVQPARVAPAALFRRIATTLAQQDPPATLQRLRWAAQVANDAADDAPTTIEVELVLAADGTEATSPSRLEAIAVALEDGGARELRRLGGADAAAGLALQFAVTQDTPR